MTELKNRESSSTDTRRPESSLYARDAAASASWTPDAGREDSHGNGTSKGDGQVGNNEASSSELSTRSETLTGVNGENPPTTDTDCRASSVDKSWGKTARQKSRKRKAKPLIPGHARDWESNDSWTSEKAREDCAVVAEETETKRRKIKRLQRKNRRLKVRHSRLKAAIREMKANMADRN